MRRTGHLSPAEKQRRTKIFRKKNKIKTCVFFFSTNVVLFKKLRSCLHLPRPLLNSMLDSEASLESRTYHLNLIFLLKELILLSKLFIQEALSNWKTL